MSGDDPTRIPGEDPTARARSPGEDPSVQARIPEENPSLLAEYLRFLREERRYWMIPVVVLVVLLGTLVVLFESSPLAPFIYALF